MIFISSHSITYGFKWVQVKVLFNKQGKLFVFDVKETWDIFGVIVFKDISQRKWIQILLVEGIVKWVVEQEWVMDLLSLGLLVVFLNFLIDYEKLFHWSLVYSFHFWTFLPALSPLSLTQQILWLAPLPLQNLYRSCGLAAHATCSTRFSFQDIVPSNVRVKTVFYHVVRSVWQGFSHDWPLGADLVVKCNYQSVFLFGKWLPVYIWIKLVFVSFAYLFPGSVIDKMCQHRPRLPIELNQLQQPMILLFGSLLSLLIWLKSSVSLGTLWRCSAW